MSEINYCDAGEKDLDEVQAFLAPFMESNFLLPRTSQQLTVLLKHGFIARSAGNIIGFAALEIYSTKLAELQCLAVDSNFRRKGVGRHLVSRVVERAAKEKVLELMAISSSDEMFMACGFDYSLPNQKRALFIQPSLPEKQSD